ncbi:MAG: GlsB/YeaQ/YmgE family stress response membrane protein [Parvularculaceae bacterium]
MTVESLVVWLLIGAIAGWLAGVIVKGYGFGLVGNIVVGIVGAFVGGWLFGALGISTGAGIVGSIIGATLGAVILLFVLRLVRRAS